AQRGWQVSLLERHAAPAQEASGYLQGVLYMKLAAHCSALSQLFLSGFGHTRRLFERLQSGVDWYACGVLHSTFDDKAALPHNRLADASPESPPHPLDPPAADAQRAVARNSGGPFCPEAGWRHPRARAPAHPRHAYLRPIAPPPPSVPPPPPDPSTTLVTTAHLPKGARSSSTIPVAYRAFTSDTTPRLTAVPPLRHSQPGQDHSHTSPA
ncbi:FAD-dependent oxidoreductase, partial [Pseudomonas syringae]